MSPTAPLLPPSLLMHLDLLKTIGTLLIKLFQIKKIQAIALKHY
jgi:hypothetical protein